MKARHAVWPEIIPDLRKDIIGIYGATALIITLIEMSFQYRLAHFCCSAVLPVVALSRPIGRAFLNFRDGR